MLRYTYLRYGEDGAVARTVGESTCTPDIISILLSRPLENGVSTGSAYHNFLIASSVLQRENIENRNGTFLNYLFLAIGNRRSFVHFQEIFLRK